jgi:hypothetical protein
MCHLRLLFAVASIRGSYGYMQVDKQLLSHTFLLGHSITLPDLVLFAVLSRAVVSLSADLAVSPPVYAYA